MSNENHNTFKGSLGDYKVVTTADNSSTLYSEYFDENCHSVSGAIAETDFNYLEGCEIATKLNTLKEITIFEVGFGLGIGAQRTFEKFSCSDSTIHFISCELDEGLVEWAKANSNCPLITSLNKREKNDLTLYKSSIGNFNLTIIIGDIRKKLSIAKDEQIFENFHAIYQDAFSPRKNPILWTKEWFTQLLSYSNPTCILSTYSAAIAIRKSMLEAGWSVFKREGFGEKRSTTIAKIDTEMILEFEKNIKNSPESALLDKLLIK